jgi:hypothetical protein
MDCVHRLPSEGARWTFIVTSIRHFPAGEPKEE